MKRIDLSREYREKMGYKRLFKLYREFESGAVCVTVRKPAQIVDGRLVGAEIDIYNATTFRIWTPKVRKALILSAKNKLRIRKLTGECELFVPASLADEILPIFGAKAKRDISAKEAAHLKAIRSKKRLEKGYL